MLIDQSTNSATAEFMAELFFDWFLRQSLHDLADDPWESSAQFSPKLIMINTNKELNRD